MPLVTDLFDPSELIGYVRGLTIEEQRNRFTLSAYLPDVHQASLEWKLTNAVLRDEDAAVVRSWDTEAPIGGRQGASRIFGELLPASKKIRLGEEERLKQESLITGNTDAIVAEIYNDARRMTRAVLARVEMARGEVLFNSSIAFNENGVTQTVTFTRNGSLTVSAGTKWDVVATADPVADMTTWVQTYIDINGVAPAFAIGSTSIIGYLLQNAKIRALASGISGAPSLVTLDTVAAVFAAFGLPPIVPYDTTTRVNGTSTRITNIKKLVLMPPPDEPLGETRWGPTAEALELAGLGLLGVSDAPGVAAVAMKTTDPVSTWTLATGTFLPILGNPDLTMTATVLT